jgi:hypothetical protein
VAAEQFVLILAIVATAASVALAYLASPTQRWLEDPLPAFPTRTTAALTALIAWRGWSEVYGVASGSFAWLLLSALITAAAIAVNALANAPKRCR